VSRLSAFAVFVVALVVPVTTANAHPGFHHCGRWDGTGPWGYQGPGFGFFHVEARRVSCPTARRLVRAHRRWESEPTARGGVSYGEGRFSNWTCWHRFVPPEATRTRCRASGGRRVRWISAA
jgi:hypothetical protein